MKKVDQAMILAAGYGKRMMPLTDTLPKPLIEVNGISMLERIIHDLTRSGIKKIIINTHHKAEKINEFISLFQNKSATQIKIVYEKEILETGGGIINVLDEFNNQPTFIVNGDILVTKQKKETIYDILNKQWDDQKMDCLMLLQELEAAIGYKGKGDFYLGAGNELLLESNYNNKKFVFAGVHITKPSIFKGLNVQNIGVMSIYKSRHFKKCFGAINPFGWVHVGNPESIKIAEDYLLTS